MLAMEFDPGPLTSWITLVSVILGTSILIAGIGARINKRVENRLKKLIIEQSVQIQPGVNGGSSLTDLHNKVDELKTDFKDSMGDVDIRHQQWQERYLADQAGIKKDWISIFVALRRMFGKPDEEQAQIFDKITESYINGTISTDFPDERRSE